MLGSIVPNYTEFLATRFLVGAAIAGVENIDYINLSHNIGIDTLINKKIIAASNIFKFIRKGEVEFKENYKGKTLSEPEWIDAMVKFPKLIERPIVVKGNKAVIGRPPENVLTLL